MLYELTVKVENNLDSLMRVMGVINRKGMSIESLTVSYIHDDKSAHILIRANEQRIRKERILPELHRLIGVESIDVKGECYE